MSVKAALPRVAGSGTETAPGVLRRAPPASHIDVFAEPKADPAEAAIEREYRVLMRKFWFSAAILAGERPVRRG